ncbi:MAG: DMT family transporter [Parvibaculaceae bacterium]
MAAPHPTPSRASTLAFLALLGAGVAVGFSPIFARLSDLAPLASAFYRMALAVPAVWLFAWLSGDRLDSLFALPRSDRVRLVLGGLAFATDIAFWHLAIANTTVLEATLLASTVPIMVTVAAVFFFGEKLKPLFILGLALALCGVATLAVQRSGAAVTPPDRLIGGIYALMAALFFAVYLLLIANVRRHASTATIMFHMSLVAALGLLPFAAATSPTLLSGSLGGWLILLGLAVVSHAGGQGLMTFALAHLPTSFSSMTGLLQTAVAAVVAWILFSEPLTPLMLASGATILAGIWICRRATAAA